MHRDVVILNRRDLDAIAIAWDELLSYIETTGDEGSLDEEEMPNGKLRWAEQRLHAILTKFGAVPSSVGETG